MVGPRQSGKTTLVKECFPKKPYVSLENPDERELATEDPRAFLARYPKGAILDEIQRTPLLFNYLQEILDSSEEDGLFILTGSNNILLQENVTQSLAGRIGVLDLLPLSYNEVHKQTEKKTLPQLIITGFYPEIHKKNRNPNQWYKSYVRTYVERDVRQIKQIENSLLFQKFIKLCAGRVGQQVNMTSLSNACGIDIRTVESWLSILEKTYIIFLLRPYHDNFNKRLVKSSKLYFYDTGLSCFLLNIKTEEEYLNSHFRGALFENFIIAEHIKNNENFQLDQQFYYWRENNGVEIDLIVENANEITPVEIKSAQTYSKDFSKNLKKFKNYSKLKKGVVLYNGNSEFAGTDGIQVKNWVNFLKREK